MQGGHRRLFILEHGASGGQYSKKKYPRQGDNYFSGHDRLLSMAMEIFVFAFFKAGYRRSNPPPTFSGILFLIASVSFSCPYIECLKLWAWPQWPWWC